MICQPLKGPVGRLESDRGTVTADGWRMSLKKLVLIDADQPLCHPHAFRLTRRLLVSRKIRRYSAVPMLAFRRFAATG
jgi:hypothetical protein